MSDTPREQMRTAIRLGLRDKFPDLPAEAAEWAIEKVVEATEAFARGETDSIEASYCKEVERALRADNENAIQVAMASIRAMG